MVKDVKTGDCFRADHLLEGALFLFYYLIHIEPPTVSLHYWQLVGKKTLGKESKTVGSAIYTQKEEHLNAQLFKQS